MTFELNDLVYMILSMPSSPKEIAVPMRVENIEPDCITVRLSKDDIAARWKNIAIALIDGINASFGRDENTKNLYRFSPVTGEEVRNSQKPSWSPKMRLVKHKP